MKSLRIALVQIQSLVGQTDKNLQKIKEFILKAKEKDVEIICFPELAVQGYTREMANEVAETLEGSSCEFLRNLAKEENITIITGFIEKSDNNKPYITQLFIDNKGNINKYRKTHLGKSEEPYFSLGNDLNIFKHDKANIGIQICWDSHFPEVSTIQALKGVEIVFAPHASPVMVGDRKEIWLKYLRARAYDNGMYVAACNLIGENGIGSNFIGGLLVIDPKGNVIAEDFTREEGILIVDLDENKVNSLRQKVRKTMRNSFYIKYRRPELYKDILNLD